MGWAAGSEILAETWNIVKDHLSPQHKFKVVKELISLFEEYDCDTVYELIDEIPIFGKALADLHPEEE